MDFKTFLNVAPMIAKARKPILLRAAHGVGKSTLVYDMVNRLGWNPKKKEVVVFKEYGKCPEGIIPYKVVERRASQMTEGELTGLPIISDNVTRWNAPDWFRECCDNPRILLMDEVDRAVLEVRQGLFEMTDSRKIYGNVLHEGTLIFAAVNSGKHGSQYSVMEMDPAELSRWTPYDLDPTVIDWLDWAVESSSIHPLIVDYVRNNEIHLEHKGDFEPNKVYPCRRSWHRLSETLVINKIMDDPKGNTMMIYNLALGFLGQDVAIHFTDFCKSYDKQVSVEDLLEHGKFDLVKDWKAPEHTAMLLKIRQNGHYSRLLSKTEIANLQKYFRMLPGELAMTLAQDFAQNCPVDKPEFTQQITDFHAAIRDEIKKLVTGGVTAATIGEEKKADEAEEN